jgi:hypothetical protein
MSYPAQACDFFHEVHVTPDVATPGRRRDAQVAIGTGLHCEPDGRQQPRHLVSRDAVA